MNQELSIKSIITDIEAHTSFLNHSPYYKVSINWGTSSSKTMFAFANNSHLDPATLTNLSQNPERLVNQPVLITYQPKGDYLHLQKIELIT